MYKKSSNISVYNTINREEVRRIEVVVGTLYCIMYIGTLYIGTLCRWYIILYNVPTTTSILLTSSLLMVLYTEILELFLYIFSSRFWSVKSFKTLSECESRIVGRSPNFALSSWTSVLVQWHFHTIMQTQAQLLFLTSLSPTPDLNKFTVFAILRSRQCVLVVHAYVTVYVCVCVCVCQRKTKDRADGMREKSAHCPRRDSNLYLWDTRP